MTLYFSLAMLDQDRLEDELNTYREDQYYDGESDGRDGLKPQHPNDEIYMMGWEKGILHHDQSFLSPSKNNYEEF